ncbi:FtsX-like permease family protein [Dactylosporangium sp. CA-233914]|uniref:FtsX-like permease family protein n=1 Tax=Dactylosporangium sp. CA-233914 TaxID=3239934 RepID=UPI003D940BC0
MLAVVWSAIRTRRGPAVVMAILVAVTAGGLGAAGWVATREAASATAALIAAAAPAQRTVGVRGGIVLGADPAEALNRFRATTESAAGLAVESAVAGVRLPGAMAIGDGPRTVAELRYRDDACANLVLTGACPAGVGEVALPAALARRLAAGVGTHLLHHNGLGQEPLALTVVATFEPREPLGWWWSGQQGDAAFTTLETVAAAGVPASATCDLLLPAAWFGHGDDGAVAAAVDRLKRGSLEVTSDADALSRAVANERYAVTHGITVAAVQLVAIGWIAIGVAAWYAAEDRRADAARIALRGARRRWVIVVTSGQSALPALVGTVAAGGGLALVLRGADSGPGPVPSAAIVSLVALALIVAADWRLTRAPVQRLLRSAPPRRAALAAAALDLTVIALAVAAGYQSAVTGEAPVDGYGLELLTPVLFATAGAVLLTRLLLPPAVAAGRAALARGRLTGGLAALSLARRTSAYRIVPVLAAAACVCGVAAQDWARADAARLHRAQAEIGADRVLTVAPVPRGRLLSAVRAADPQGRHAMAVVVSGASGPGPRLLTVDSPRLRAVAAVDPGAVIARLHPPAPAPIAVHGTALTLRAAGDGTVALGMTLAVSGTGETVHAQFGAIGGDGVYRAEAPACEDGCRLVALDLRGDPGAALDLMDLRADGRVAVDGPAFADPARWRTAAGDTATGVQRLRGEGRMRLATIAPAGGKAADRRVYAVDAPLPLPVLATGGAVREPDQYGTAELQLAGVPVPIRPATAEGLPARSGGVILADLEYAERLTAGLAEPARPGDVDQVWLARGAPPGLVERLTAAGLTVIGGDSVAAARDRQAHLGPAAALRLNLLAAVLALLLASAALSVVAAVQGRERRAEVEALRRQGVPARVVRAAGRWSALAPVLLALAIGLAAATAARWLLRSPVRPFADRWVVDEPPVSVSALLAAVAVAALCFGLTALASGRIGGRR